MTHHQKKPIRHLLLAGILLVGGIAYLLADRYLIQHVEIADVSAYSLVPSATPASPGSKTTLAGTATSPPDTVAMEPVSSEGVYLDDWQYAAEDVTISIEKVSTGSGRDTLTYFVADVVVTDASTLGSAFANNQFGRNIIETTSAIAAENDAIFAINGDYYGFRSDGIVIRNGVIYRDQPARTGLVFYRDGSLEIYDETSTTAEDLLAAGAWNTLSFGPALLVDGEIPANLTTVEVDTNFGNHSIQGNQPRTGVGMISVNHFIFIVVDGRSNGYSRGATLTEFARMFVERGCSQAYNIDGGGSSTMYFNGRVVNNPLGRNQERGTSDILLITS